MYSCYDTEFNKIVNHADLFGSKGEEILKNVTHIMDCECYRINSLIYFREVSLIYMDSGKYEMFHCFIEDAQDYEKMTKQDKRTIHHQFQIHGLKLYNYRKNPRYYNQAEFLDEFKKKFSGRPEILFGYKGGKIESDLCALMGVECVNLEHFGVEKYEKIARYFLKDIKVCREHVKHNVHCSLYEVRLFAAQVAELTHDRKKRDKILYSYG